MARELQLQNALVLHSRPYRNTSLLVDFFCEKDGLLRCVAKGFKKKANSLLSPFCIYEIGFVGRTDLKTLTQCEVASSGMYLQKQALFCGLYVNELLLRVLYAFDPHPELFKLSCDLFQRISQASSQKEMEYYLRLYEFSLLREIGYLVDLNHDCVTGEFISPENSYQFDQELGFTKFLDANTSNMVSNQKVISGNTIICIKEYSFVDFSETISEQFLREAKMLSRLMLAPYLGGKPLQSRNLFQKFEV